MNNSQSFISKFPVKTGFVLGVLPLPIHYFLPLPLSHELAALSVVLIAGVYLGYAFMDERLKVMLIELTISFIFFAGAWIGINGFPILIILALFLHGIWDLLHHNLIDTKMPRWYIPLCAVFDWITALALAVIWYFPIKF